MKRATVQNENQISTTLRRGANAMKNRDFVGAEAAIKSVLKTHRNNFDALQLLAMTSLNMGKFDQAAKCFRQMLSQKPRDIGLMQGLATALAKQKKYQSAIAQLRKALTLDNSRADLWKMLAGAYYESNDATTAIATLKQAISIKPEMTSLHLQMADYLIEIGQIDEAKKIFENVMALKDANETFALTGYAGVNKFSAEDPLPKYMSTLAEQSLSEGQRKHTRFIYATAKALIDQNEISKAFNLLENVKKQSNQKFNVQAFDKHIGAIIETFTHDLIAKKQEFGNSSNVPVLIVGMPRSGTTLVETICSRHKDISGAGEVTYLRDMLSALERPSVPGKALFEAVHKLSKENIGKISDHYLRHISERAGRNTRITDKLPFNFESLGLANLLFPNLKVIHCTRHPLDNCVSYYTNYFEHGDHSHANDLSSLGAYYLGYKRLMAHWDSALNIKIHELNYETFLSDPESGTRALIEYLGLNWDESCLDTNRTDLSVKTISKWQVRQPLYRSSVDRWKAFESHLDPLKQTLAELLEPA